MKANRLSSPALDRVRLRALAKLPAALDLCGVIGATHARDRHRVTLGARVGSAL